MIGYARVSMSDQSNDRQIAELVRAGCDPKEIFSDKASGRNMLRPGWRDVWRYLRPGDVLVVLSVDRLGRNLVNVIDTVTKLQERKIGLKVLSGAIDTTTSAGRFMLAVVAAMAEWERELIVERTLSGLRVAKEKGKVGGRKQTITEGQVQDAIRRQGKGEAMVDIAKEYGVTPAAIYKRIKEGGK
jgi:DNA invertase Pin-like site-specific DNA recombinase